MKLIVISCSDKLNLKNDIHSTKEELDAQLQLETSIVTQMFENGLETFHLRKPKFTTKEITAYLDRIPAKFHHKIVMHSHHILALKYKTKGISLGRKDKGSSIKKWLKLRLIKSKKQPLVIASSFGRISNLIEETYKYDYVFLSPIFDGLTGNFATGIKKEQLKGVLSRIPHKVIARGGVSTEKIELIKEMGFDGMAIHSIIWKKKDPLQEFIRFKEKFEELGIIIE